MDITVLRMKESKRDAGLVRVVGPWGLTASIINALVGAGIFAVPGALAISIGPYAPLAFLACAVAVGSVAICFAEGGSRIPTSGGAYGYIDAAFGPLTGYVAGTLLWFGDLLACGGVAAALADVGVSLLPQSFKAPAHAAVISITVRRSACAWRHSSVSRWSSTFAPSSSSRLTHTSARARADGGKTISISARRRGYDSHLEESPAE